MPILNLRRFANVDVLKSIRDDNLLALLEPYRDYLVGRGFSWPNEVPLDYPVLCEILVNPDEHIPDRLVNDLYLVSEMATESGMDDLLDIAQAHGIDLTNGSEPAPADIAVEMWLQHPELLEEKHGEQFIFHPRSMESFQGRALSVSKCPSSTKEDLSNLEHDLSEWFEQKNRGRYIKVIAYPRDRETYFLIRHGDPLKREGSLKDGKSESVCYRPEKHDVVVFVPEYNELRINANSKGEKDLYRMKFGLRLFGDEDYFEGEGKYTLQPLRDHYEDALVCSDVEGMERVTLKEIQFLYQDPNRTTLIIRSAEVFSSCNGVGVPFPEHPYIASASFLVKFRNQKTPRTVVIRPSNRAKFTRDDDAPLVEEWLKKRGFIKTRVEQDYAEDSEILANA